MRDLGNDVRAVGIHHRISPIWHRNPSTGAGLDYDTLTARGVIANDVGLLDRRDDQVSSSGQGYAGGDVQGQITSGLGSVRVRQADRKVGIRGEVRVAVAYNRLLQRSAEVGVGRATPRTGLFTGADKLDLEVG